jgi:hypothetical protein
MTNFFLKAAQIILLLIAAIGLAFAQKPGSSPLICRSVVQVDVNGIEDPTERDALSTALNKEPPFDRGNALDAFASNYPNSPQKLEVLEEAMRAFLISSAEAQAADSRILTPLGDTRAGDVAMRILRIDPDHLCALAALLETRRSMYPPEYKDWIPSAEHGLRILSTWSKPDSVPEDEYTRQRDRMAAVFYGAAGIGALLKKDYLLARENYLKSLSIEPNNVLDDYQLGIADMEMTPVDPKGFWYLAKAISISKKDGNAVGASEMWAYARAKYSKYHGTDRGLDQIVIKAVRESAPPAGFTVRAAQRLD